MPSQQTEALISLIRTMTKSEKRTFRISVNNDHQGDDKLYVKLFDYLDKSSKYDEVDLLRRVPDIKKSQLPNLKSHLYKHILSCLRNLSRHMEQSIQIRESIDYAIILQSRGMIKASLETLDRAKKLASQFHETILLYDILAHERNIESQYITGNSTTKAIQISTRGDHLLRTIDLHNRLANLSLMIYGKYLQHGYVKNKEDHESIKTFFFSQLPQIDIEKLGFYEKVYFYQSHVWYNHMTQDFLNYFKYAQKWVEVFHQDATMIEQDPVLYIKGLHNTLNALYLANKAKKFEFYYAQYLSFGEAQLTLFSHDVRGQFLLFKHVHLLNGIFLTADYDSGIKQLAEMEDLLRLNPYHWDVSRLMVFYYKIACVYFGADDYHRALDYLYKIIQVPRSPIREDIQCFARILSLISHYELGNEYLLPYQIKSVYRYLIKMEDLHDVQSEILHFVRRTPSMDRRKLHDEFNKLHDTLLKIKKNAFQGRAFLYLDIISWLESKIIGKRISEIIRSKIKS
jgi:hypothetical protein